jgi:putative protease
LPFCVGETFREGENALSLKDLSLINHIKEIKECGVASLKIEGRMKRPEYVAAAVLAVKAALSGEEPDIETLRSVFSRSGFTDGYFTGNKYSMFGSRTKEDVIAADKVLPEIRQKYADEIPSIPVNIDFTAKFGELVQLYISETRRLDATEREKIICVCVTSDPPEKSVKIPTTAEDINVQLSKLGGTVFFAKEIKTDISDGLFIPKAQINALRREAVNGLAAAITEKNTPKYSYSDYKLAEAGNRKGYPTKFIAEIFHKKQIEAIPDIIASGGKIVVPIDLISDVSEKYYANIIISLPKMGIIPCNMSNFPPELFAGAYCQNLSHIAFANKYGFTKYGGIHLNVTNAQTVNEMKKNGFVSLTASIECKFREIEAMPEGVGIYAYGRVPVMLLALCPIKGGGFCENSGDCPKNCKKTLTDRTSRHFTVNCKKNYGYVELLNPETLSLEDCTDYIHADFLHLSFFDETSCEIAEITDAFLNKSGKKRENITRGLYKGKRE